MVNKEMRLEILDLLYQHAIKKPRDYTSKEDLLQQLSLDENELDFQMGYLEEKGLVRLEKFLGGSFLAQITVYGIDMVESSGSKTAIQHQKANYYG